MAGQPRRFVVFLAVAAVVLVCAAVWRSGNPRPDSWDPSSPQTLELRQFAPPFELYDQGTSDKKPRIVNLGAYLHRHQIVLVFYEGDPENCQPLIALRDAYEKLESNNIKVFGVSTRLPQENRKTKAPFPFPLLSDVNFMNPDSAHKMWGRLKVSDRPGGGPETIPGVFLIDRAGTVAWEGKLPLPLAGSADVIGLLLNGA